MNFLLTSITQEGYNNIFDPVEGYFATLFVFFVSAMIVAYIIAISVAVAAYILQSIGLMRMLKKVGYARPWHAWVPILNQKAIGELADMYDNGSAPSGFGKKLFREMIAVIVLSFAAALFSVLVSVFTAFGISNGIAGALLSLLSVADIALSVITIVYMVHFYMALWRIYKIFSPENATTFLVLSIFIGLAQSIIIFIIGNKEPQNLRKDPTDFGPSSESSNYTYDPGNE